MASIAVKTFQVEIMIQLSQYPSHFINWSLINHIFLLTCFIYKNRCGLIVYETVTNQMTVEFKLLQVPLQPSIMNQSTRVHTITEAVKGPQIQNVKLYIKHVNRPNLMQKWWPYNNYISVLICSHKEGETPKLSFWNHLILDNKQTKWNECICS